MSITPYTVHLAVENMRQVLQGFSANDELMQQLSPTQAWALGRAEGGLELLFSLLPRSLVTPSLDRS
jgi:hypothetical protein